MTDDETKRRFAQERMARIDASIKARWEAEQTMGPLAPIRLRAETYLDNPDSFAPPLTETEKAELDRIASEPREEDDEFLDTLVDRLPEFQDVGQIACKRCKKVTLHIHSEETGIICSECRTGTSGGDV